MPLAKICVTCRRIHLGTGTRCTECQPLEDHRRHTKQRQHGRDTSYWRRLCTAVKARDEHRCRRCGSTRHLTVHLDPRLKGNHQAATMDDCTTLCRSCHGTTDAPRSSRPNQ